VASNISYRTAAGITESLKAVPGGKMPKVRPLAHTLECAAIPCKSLLTVWIRRLSTAKMPSFGLEMAV
jgi:hypothetical protein